MTWCAAFEARARSAGASGDGLKGPRLIHTASTPIIDQLATLIPGLDELTVMSPFFDNDGYATRRTAKKLGCSTIRVAVPPKVLVSSFPFEEASSWGINIVPVWPNSIDPNRPLHAKWFEFRGPHLNGVMTGSANATRQALCTTNNIEVSVLRRGPIDEEWAKWKQSRVPASFSPAIYSAAASKDLLAHATLTTDVLEGMILGLSVASGSWDGSLVKPNGDTRRFKTHLDAVGHFRLSDLSFAEFAISSGVQIILSFANLSARGWVQSEDILRMTGLEYSSRDALLRFIARENTEDDDVALLEYFAIHAHRHLASFSGKIKVSSGPSEPDQTSSLVTVELEELAPTETPSAVRALSTGMAEASLKRILAQFRKSLLGSRPNQGSHANHPISLEVESDNGDPDEALDVEISRELSSDGIRDAMRNFDREMRNLIASPDLNIAASRGVLVLWFEVTASMLLMRKRDVAATYSFMSQWVNIASQTAKAKADVDSLEQHFVTSIAVLSAKIAGDKAQLHELLESFYGTAVEIQRLKDALLPAVGIPFGALRIAGDSVLKESLTEVLNCATLRQEVVAVIAGVKSGAAIDVESPLFRGTTGHQILSFLQSISGADRFKEQLDNQLACAKCFMRLPDAMETNLKYSRMALHCGWVTVRTKL